ncbi:hypothetical protein LXL04_006253 [Taraxacum kok-saghyz]
MEALNSNFVLLCSDRGPMYDSDFEQSDFEDGSSTPSERGFVVDEELEDSDLDDVVSFKLPTDAFLYDLCHSPLPKDKKILEDELIKEEGIAGETSAKGKEKMDADGRVKENMDASVTQKGLQEIPVIMDFTDHKLDADLLRLGYSEDTIYQELDDDELHVDVEEEPKIAMVPETEEDEGVPETQSSQRVLRKLSQRSLLKKRSEKAKEIEAEMVPETEEDVAESQGSQSLLRKRRKSERIVKKKLGHRISRCRTC